MRAKYYRDINRKLLLEIERVRAEAGLAITRHLIEEGKLRQENKRHLAAEERYHALLNAICDRWDAGLEPLPEWVEEAWDMCQHSRRTSHE